MSTFNLFPLSFSAENASFSVYVRGEERGKGEVGGPLFPSSVDKYSLTAIFCGIVSFPGRQAGRLAGCCATISSLGSL